MTQSTVEFGYYPRFLDFVSGAVTVATLPGLDQIVADVAAKENVDGDWIYSGPQFTRNFGGPVYERPYPRRVFDMPKTHTICHAASDGADHTDFHVWALSFFLGMRLTTAEAGFLDATTLKPGKLVDFVLFDDGSKVPPLAEAFWLANRHGPSCATRWRAAVHAFFIAQNPQWLQFEQFIYLYTAIDACFALAKALSPVPVPKHLRHSERIDWMCKLYGMPTPGLGHSAACRP